MCPGTKRKAFRKETPEEKAARDRAAKKRLIDGLWLAAAAKTTLTVSQSAGGNTSGPEEACSTPSRNRGESLSQPKPVDRKGQTANKSKIQLAKQSKAAKSDSRMAKLWTAQVSTRTVETETNAKGLKRKLFNPERGSSQNRKGMCLSMCVWPPR